MSMSGNLEVRTVAEASTMVGSATMPDEAAHPAVAPDTDGAAPLDEGAPETSNARIAILIGVARTGAGLPELKSVAPTIANLKNWFGENRYSVRTFCDAGGNAVQLQDIYNELQRIVDEQICEQLVIYFTGHGFWKNETDLWLLSGAPVKSTEAISVRETIEDAKNCGIGHVVLISDACRSVADTIPIQRIPGAMIFPNDGARRQPGKVDRMLASGRGQAAYEAIVDGKMESIFTLALRKAYKNAPKDQTRSVTVADETFDVVPNRQLEALVVPEVQRQLANIDLTLDQAPFFEIVSDDDAYIGRWEKVPIDPQTTTSPATSFSLRNALKVKLDKALVGAPLDLSSGALKGLRAGRQLREFARISSKGGIARRINRFETGTGFTFRGAEVAEVVTPPGITSHIETTGHVREVSIRIDFSERAHRRTATALLILKNGWSVPLAVLRGYIGHVRFIKGAVSNVSYVPSQQGDDSNPDRWHEYNSRRAEIDKLRAVAAVAAQHGALFLDTKSEADNLGQRLLHGKQLDPSLGLYAAYAFNRRAEVGRVEDIQRFMRMDLHADLYDVRLIAWNSGSPREMPEVAPFCPMLVRGWNLLRTRGVIPPKVVEDAMTEGLRGLWTMFRPARTRLLADAMRQGELS